MLGVYAVALVATVTFYMAPTQVPFLLEGLRAGPALTGIVVAGSTLASVLAALGFPALRRRLRASGITTLSVALLGAGWLLIGTTDMIFGTAAGLLVGGAGVRLAVPTFTLHLSELARRTGANASSAASSAGSFLASSSRHWPSHH